MVAAPVAELQFIGLRAVGQADHLVAETDAEDGQAAPELFYQLNHRLYILGVAGAVGEKEAVRLHLQYLLGRGVPGHHGHIAASGV